MAQSEDIKVEPDISGTKPWENLSLQDALIIIAIYAAQVDPAAKDDVNIQRITDLAKNHPLFVGEPSDAAARTHRLAKSVGKRNFPEAVGQATKSLTLKLRQTAFEWAADLAVDNGILPKEKQARIEQLKIKLFIDTNVANKIVNEAIAKSKR